MGLTFAPLSMKRCPRMEVEKRGWDNCFFIFLRWCRMPGCVTVTNNILSEDLCNYNLLNPFPFRNTLFHIGAVAQRRSFYHSWGLHPSAPRSTERPLTWWMNQNQVYFQTETIVQQNSTWKGVQTKDWDSGLHGLKKNSFAEMFLNLSI